MRSKAASWLKFTKMHALGNDFVVIDAVTQQVRMTPAKALKIADRHTGIGCDQILLIEPPTSLDLDFSYRIFNQDGGEVSQCGNGARCFAKFVHDRKLTAKKLIRVSTHAGELELACNQDRSYSVTLGVPDFSEDHIPLQGLSAAQGSFRLEHGGEPIEFQALSLGNPHAVISVENVESADVAGIGAFFQQHKAFPQSVNVGFMQVLDRQTIRLRVFERGAGETLACGSGACAAAIAGIASGLLDSPVTVNLPLGKLEVCWNGIGTPVTLKGPATTVFHGRMRI